MINVAKATKEKRLWICISAKAANPFRIPVDALIALTSHSGLIDLKLIFFATSYLLETRYSSASCALTSLSMGLPIVDILGRCTPKSNDSISDFLQFGGHI